MSDDALLLVAGIGLLCAVMAVGGWWADGWEARRDARRRNRR